MGDAVVSGYLQMQVGLKFCGAKMHPYQSVCGR